METRAVDISDSKNGGVMKAILKEGLANGECPCQGSNVFVHYTGKLLDGEQFDSSRGKGKPLDFILGKGHVIPAWELAIETMKKGEICTITCSPEYAYGEVGRPPTIPSNATLVFEIELLYWTEEPVTLDSLVVKKIIKKGKGSKMVEEGATVYVELIGKDGDRIFDQREVKFVVGEGGEKDIIPGVDFAVKTMKKGEIARITSDSSYAFGDVGRPEWGILPNMSVIYQVQVKSFEQLTPVWELSTEDRINSARITKERGKDYFKQGKFSLALSKFNRLISLVESLSVAEDLAELPPMILAGHLNAALCYLKLSKYRECIESCDRALYRDPDNIKALYRKARAQFHLSYWDESNILFQRVLQLDPKNREAKKYYIDVKKKLEEYKKRDKYIFGNMFDKFAAEDEKKLEKQKQMESDKDVFVRATEEANDTFAMASNMFDKFAAEDEKKLEKQKQMESDKDVFVRATEEANDTFAMASKNCEEPSLTT